MSDWIEGFEKTLPHVRVVGTDGSQYLFPVALLEDWIEGRQEITLENMPIIRAMMKEWWGNLKEENLWDHGWEKG